MNFAAGWAVHFKLVEHWGAPTDYFRPWWNLDRYYNTNIFLTKENNEIDPTPAFKERILNLTNMGLFKWDDDEVVHPKESEWFGAYN